MIDPPTPERSRSEVGEEIIGVLIADDHPVVRQGLALMLTHEPGLAAIGEASSAREAIEMYALMKPDVMLLDLRMGDLDGAAAIAIIRESDPEARVIVLTNHEGTDDIYRSLRAGARGYVLKGATTNEILAAIRRVHAGGTYIPPEVAAKLSERLLTEDLTQRELTVLRLIARGRSNAEIAQTLSITEATVKYHVTNILAKLGVPDRTRAAIVALERGLAHL